MKILVTISITICALFIGCQTVVDAEQLLETEEKVYITGFLSPSDTVFRINVSKALPAIGTPLPVQDEEARSNLFLIKNALVKLLDEQGNETTLTYVDSLQTYIANASTLSIESEKNYFLEVNVDNQTYNASCFIPKKVGLIEHEITNSSNQFDGTFSEIQYRFEDFANEKNFYMLGGIIKSTFTFEGEEPSEYTSPLYIDSDQLLNDNIEDGGILSGKGSVYTPSNSDEVSTRIEVTLQVGHIEEIVFQYMRAEGLNFNADGNPFVEYSIAPSNFLDEGAVGIFAGYQITEKVVVIQE